MTIYLIILTLLIIVIYFGFNFYTNSYINKICKYIEIQEKINNDKIEILQLHTSSHPCVIKLFNDYFLDNRLIIKSDNTYPSACYYLITRDGAKKILDKYVDVIDNIIHINLSHK